MQRTVLSGWLLLINSDLRILRLTAALAIAISFLVVLLVCEPYRRRSDHAVAAGCQVLFVGIFMGGIIVRLYGDISNDTAGSPALAHRFLGLRSSEEAVTMMICIALTMLVLLVCALAADTYWCFVQERLRKKWSVATMDPPHTKWQLRGIYACFLSHYKLEAASEARYMHDTLRKMLLAPVFLDSSALNDLRNLVTEGVQKSDTIVLLATKGVLSRPWCLIELLEASRQKIPIVIVRMQNGGFVYDEACTFLSGLEAEMTVLNRSGLDLLHDILGADLSELKEACLVAIDENRRSEVVFDPHAGDSAMVAMLKDVVERMAKAVGNTVMWKGSAQAFDTRRRAAFPFRRQGTKALTNKEGITLEDLQAVPLPRPHVKSSRQRCFRGRHLNKRKESGTSSGGGLLEQEVNNVASEVFVCCSRLDAVMHARVLRSELEMRLDRACAVGGGIASSEFIEQSEAVVVLLTVARNRI